MDRLKIIFFPVDKNDTAGNKRLMNLSKYLDKMGNTETCFFNPSGEKQANLGHPFASLQKLYFKFADLFRILLILFKERENQCINVLYFYTGRRLMLHRILLAKLLGYKILVDIVENPNSLRYSISWIQSIRTLYFLFLYRIIPLYGNAIIVVSNLLKNKVLNDFREKIPVFLMTVTYDPDDFNVVPEQYPYPALFYGGSYGSNYDFDSLFQAYNRISIEFPQLRLFLSGNINMQLKNKIKESVVNQHNIVFLGFLEEKTYFKTICSMTVLCMPRNNTIQANAGFPFKLAEYFATGRPVLTSKSSDVSAYVNDNEAFIYEPGDSIKIESLMRNILNNYETALKIGMNGRLKAQQYFDSRKIAGEFHSFVAELSLS